MELSDGHLQAIKTAFSEVDYGSVIINVAANTGLFEIITQKRVRVKLDKSPLDTPCD